MDNKRTYSINKEEPDFNALGLPQPPRGEADASHAGLTVPEGFFDAFRQRMETAIDEEVHSQQERRVEHLRHLRRWSVAASVVLIAGLAALFGRIDRDAAPQAVQMASVPVEIADSETDDEMLLAGLSDFDIYETYYAMAE